MHERGEGVGAIRRCSSCGLLNEAERETCLGCGTTLPLTPLQWHHAMPVPDASPPQPIPAGDLPDSALVPATIVMPGRGPTDAGLQASTPQPASTNRTVAMLERRTAQSSGGQAHHPASSHLNAGQRRRRRLLPVLAIAATVVAVAAAYVALRPGADPSGTVDTIASAAPTPGLQPTETEMQAVEGLLALTSSTAAGAPDASVQRTGMDTYPNGSVTGWSVDSRHTVWVGRDPSGQPTIVRMQESASSGQDDEVDQGSEDAVEDALSPGQALAFALEASKGSFPDFRGAYVRPVPRAEVNAPGGAGVSSYVYTWQYMDEVADGTKVSLPKWVTVWVDVLTGDVTGYDSLDIPAGSTNELKPNLKGEEAAQQAILDAEWRDSGLKSDQCETTLLLTPVRYGNGWKPPELVWKVIPSDGSEAKYVADGSEQVLSETQLYLPALEPDWEEPPFDAAR